MKRRQRFEKRISMLPWIIVHCAIFAFSSALVAEKITVASPDGNTEITVDCDGSIAYAVSYKSKEIIKPSRIGIQLEDKLLGDQAKIKSKKTRSVDSVINPLYGKSASLSEKYNETRIDFEGDYALLVRAYDEGVTYRFITNLPSEIVVQDEIVAFNLIGDPEATFPETNNYTSWELMYIDYANVSAILENKRAITPVLFSYPDNVKVVIAESDLWDYPGIYVKKTSTGFVGDFARYPTKTVLGSWGNFVPVVEARADFIAKTSGTREFPWRVFIVTDDDKTLLSNELIYKLAKPQAEGDFSWVKPGKAAWEWWHDAMLPSANIPSGMDNRNTDLYKHYIDFAAEIKLEYLMIDAGWADNYDLSKVNPKVDIHELVRYAKSKNVDIFVWCVATTLMKNPDGYMKQLSDWGIVGIKVDFFDSDNQEIMQWYEEIAKKAAQYKLMVNFHGCSKPTGMQRTYPNIINYEAVRGGESTKWDSAANPQHHVTIPFTRMLAGTMDYTPGGMRNRTLQGFRPLDPGMPSTLGTRCHELSMFVIFDQYFAMLCDSPSEYRKYPDIMRFLSAVPVAYDETKVLDAKAGKYVLMAKRKGKDWYIGGMTNWTARSLEVDFSFLESGKKYTAEIYRDGFDVNIYHANEYICETKEIEAKTKLTIPLAAGGGFVIRIFN